LKWYFVESGEGKAVFDFYDQANVRLGSYGSTEGLVNLTQLPLRPPTHLVISSLLVVGGCLWLASLSLGVAIAVPDPFSFCGMLFALPLTLGLALVQYRGTFRQSRSAARITSVALYVVGGLLLIAGVTSFGEILAEGIPIGGLLPLLLGLTAAGVACLSIGYWNGSWAYRLGRQVVWEKPKATSRYSRRELLVAMAVVAVFTAMTAYVVKTEPPPRAENVSASEARLHLPVGASNVSYARGARGLIAYEFDCDEVSFRNWFDEGIGTFESNAAQLPLEEITSPISITRYKSFLPLFQFQASPPINNGLHYAWTKEDRGVYAAYDRDAGRGYYYSHSH
jgi:hypothetical protein